MPYKVPFIDYPKHYQGMKKPLLKIFDDVLFDRADLILRRDVKEFENNIASFLGTKYAVGVNSCTDALFLSLYAAGIKSGDEVITVSHTFIATIEPIVHCGAKPILIDIGEDYNMDTSLIDKAITPKTKAIIPVHLNGRACNMKKLMAIAKKHNLMVIEDAAQTLGGTFNGKKAGSFGLASCFSFFPAKLLGAPGDAGVVCTNSKKLADKIRILRDHGRKSKNHLACYGFNSRLDNMHATILNYKLKLLPNWLKRRRRVAEIYRKSLQGVESLVLPHFPGDQYYDVYQNYVIQAKKRDSLVKHLTDNGVETLISWRKPNHKQKALGLDHFMLPVTERISRNVISLPMNTEVTNEQVEYVAKTIKSFYCK